MAQKKSVAVNAQPAHPRVRDDAVTPLVDVYQTEGGTTFLAIEVPGATLEKTDLQVDKGVLTVTAETENSPCGEKYAQTYSGLLRGIQYFRAFALSDEVDREKIDASLADGVLTVALPRAAAARTRKINVRTE